MALKHLLKMNPLKALSTVISLTLKYTCKTQTMLYNSKLHQSRPATSEHHFWSGVGDHQVTCVSSSAASAKMREAERQRQYRFIVDSVVEQYAKSSAFSFSPPSCPLTNFPSQKNGSRMNKTRGRKREGEALGGAGAEQVHTGLVGSAQKNMDLGRVTRRSGKRRLYVFSQYLNVCLIWRSVEWLIC